MCEAQFVKLQRFVITCSACGKRTDCMAVDAAAAGVKFNESGWRGVEIKFSTPELPEEVRVEHNLVCRNCARLLEKRR